MDNNTPIYKMQLQAINDNSIVPKWVDTFNEDQYRKFNSARNKIIENSFLNEGVNLNDHDFIKKNVHCVISEEDKFEHYFLYYGTPNQKRVISVEKMPDMKMDGNKITIRSMYY